MRNKSTSTTVHRFLFTVDGSVGFSILEVMLAVAIFAIFGVSAAIGIVGALQTNRVALEKTIATQYASEGLEAARSIRNQSYPTFTSPGGPTGISQSPTTGSWQWSGSSNILDSRYTRTITLSTVQRDGNGNIVSSGGTDDPNTRKVTSQVTWNFVSNRSLDVSLSEYLTNWKAAIVTSRGGMLVYGDGGTTTDAMKYRLLNPDGTWAAVQNFPDFDTDSTNKVLMVIRVYASSNRNEKIALTRHYNGASQYIYAHVWDGTTWSSSLFGSFNATNFLTVHNVDGTYLNNGDFLAVYSDNSQTPKYRIWNGVSWTPDPPAVGAPTTIVGNIPLNIVIKNRPNTDEALMAVYDQGSDTNTSYFDSTGWSAALEHAIQAPTNTKEFVDFSWSVQNPAKGALIAASASNDRSMNMKICTAPCPTPAGWSAATQTSNQGVLGAMEIDSRKGAEEYITCDKDASNDIYCFKGNNTPLFTNPSNRLITNNTDSGIQRSFDFVFEAISGTQGVIVYSDATNIAKLKKYQAGINPDPDSFDLNPTSINPSNPLNSVLKTVRLRPLSDNDDIMILMGDASSPARFYTAVWDGSNNSIYTSPPDKAFLAQGSNGSSGLEYWYGFAWDQY
ncbi:MAG: hypothetical protein UY21_C0011G0037 [Microgenomates group bacterium GW2011_GWA1_48_10]|uniref:Uncharacterized protein n=1 Tax=Candidatus Gottesmanbacteria bacterium RIFCSPHIGHO2_01_FULL_47_48 TaxID=1798381 RepID=A0A1F6A4S8_9BACT|nr:MAG: hypothetical protein UY21_C0011G0037 [Microgenomates group bacterium GW2011_GWA1_48_10]OGG19740.1 MAG: hypothetical protein A2721_01140 [Candidatus Gottesmanbacteria bacterium RIFCSPHIGHO2_01_FULL_47_48]